MSIEGDFEGYSPGGEEFQERAEALLDAVTTGLLEGSRLASYAFSSVVIEEHALLNAGFELSKDCIDGVTRQVARQMLHYFRAQEEPAAEQPSEAPTTSIPNFDVDYAIEKRTDKDGEPIKIVRLVCMPRITCLKTPEKSTITNQGVTIRLDQILATVGYNATSIHN